MKIVLRAFLIGVEWLLHKTIVAMEEVTPHRWTKFIAMYYPDAQIRKSYWSKLGVSMGKGTFANPGLMVVNIPSDTPDVVIGNNVSIAPNVVLVTHSSPNNSELLQGVPYVAEKLIRHARITIQDDVWLGASAVILPGVTIGRCAIIGAGSVVVANVPSMCVVAGVPARIVRNLELPEP